LLDYVVQVGLEVLTFLVAGKYNLFRSMLDHRDHFFSADFALLFRIGLVKLAALHNQVIDLKLPGCSFHDLFFDGFFCDEPINNDFPLLANTMGPVNSLQVHLRIPIRVK
jgi:hypothetical protein